MVTPLVVMDGPMGTELAARGVPTPGPGWSAYAIRTSPEVVVAIHEDYARAGAAVHRTNTFRTQPRIFGDDFRALAREAVALARRGARSRPGATIAGSIAPIEDCYRPDLAPDEATARREHAALARVLAESGCDRLICETFPSATEARICVEEAVRTGLPTWVALTAGPDASLMTPPEMERAARACAAAGAQAVLACCIDAERTLAYVEKLACVGVPFGAYANAGDPARGLGWGAPEPERAAERYAALASSWIEAGASIVGACCGTGPLHVASLARLASELKIR